MRAWLGLVLGGALMGCIQHGPEPAGLDVVSPVDDPGGDVAVIPDGEVDGDDDSAQPQACRLRVMTMATPLFRDRDAAVAAATRRLRGAPRGPAALSIDEFDGTAFHPRAKLPSFARSYEPFSVAHDALTDEMVLVAPETIVRLHPGEAPEVTPWPKRGHRKLTTAAVHRAPDGLLWLAYTDDGRSVIATLDPDGPPEDLPEAVPLLAAADSHGWRFARQARPRPHAFVAWSDVVRDPHNLTMRVALIDTRAAPPQATTLPDLPGADADAVPVDAVEARSGDLFVLWSRWAADRSRHYRVSRWDGAEWSALGDELGDASTTASGTLHVARSGELVFASIEKVPAKRRADHVVTIRTWRQDRWTIDRPAATPARGAYKNAPNLFVHDGVLHLAYLSETATKVYSDTDIAFGMVKYRKTARAASKTATHPRDLRLMARRGGRWTEVPADGPMLPDEGMRFDVRVLGCR